MSIYSGSSAGQFAINARNFGSNIGSRNAGIGARQCADSEIEETKWKWSDYLPLLGFYSIFGVLGLLIYFIKIDIIPGWYMPWIILPSICVLLFLKKDNREA